MFQHSVSNTQVYILSNSTTYIRKQFCSPLSNPVFMCFLETWSPKMNPNWRDHIYSCKSASLVLGLQACVFMPSSQITSFSECFTVRQRHHLPVFCLNQFTNISLHNTDHSVLYRKYISRIPEQKFSDFVFVCIHWHN